MSKQCAFTICTKSYIGLATTLKKSFLKYNRNFDFYIVIVDANGSEKFDDIDNWVSAKSIMLQYVSEEQFIDMAFKYDVTEFSTSIKPFAIMNFIESDYELVSYFDPDIAFYSEFKELLNEDKSIFITPHILTMQDVYTGDDYEGNILKYGIYNCGFIAFRKNDVSLKILSWWKNRLQNLSFADAEHGIYTDQKWIDFIPSFVDAKDLKIIKNYGCNVAPWNYFEREIIIENEIYYVRNRNNVNSEIIKLCFAHFSGFNYKGMQTGDIQHTYRKLNEYKDIKYILFDYGKLLLENEASKYFTQKYGFANYSNGVLILKFHRRLYRALKDKGVEVVSPFNYENAFFQFIKNNRVLSKINIDINSKKMISNYSKKEKMMFRFYKLLFSFFGVNKFTALLLALRKYSNFESQINWMKI